MGRTLSGLEPPRMNTTLLHCAQNVSAGCTYGDLSGGAQPAASTTNLTCGQRGTPPIRAEDVFFLYRLSSFWSSFIAMLATVSLSLLFSLYFGSRQEFGRSLRLTSPTFLRLWTWLGLLPDQLRKPEVEGDMKPDQDCSQGELATMVAVAKVPCDHPSREDGSNLLS